jgi:hypothetical protein
MVQCTITRLEETMSTETLEQWSKLSRSALDSLKELSGINIKLAERLAEQQFELVSASIDASVKGANLATAIVAEVREEYSEWVEGRLKDASTPINRAAAGAAPSSAKRSA